MKPLLYLALFIASAILNAGPSTPNCTLELNELLATQIPQLGLETPPPYVYVCKSEGSMKEVEALLIVERSNDQKEIITVYIDSEGVLKSRENHDETLAFCFYYGYGEPVTLHLLSCEDGKKAKTERSYAQYFFIPQPLMISGNSGVELHCVTIDTFGKMFGLGMFGLSPNELVKFESISCNEILQFSVVSDAKGMINFILFPAVIGKANGPFQITASDSTSEPLVLKQYWGDLAFTPVDRYVAPETVTSEQYEQLITVEEKVLKIMEEIQ